MEIDEIESFYKKGNDLIEKDFLSKLSSGYDKTKLEKEYKEKTEALRQEYQKKCEKYIEEQKIKMRLSEEKRVKSKNQKQNFKRLEVKHFDFNPTLKEKISFKWELFLFRSRIKKNNFINKATPGFLRLFFMTLKINYKNFKADSARFFRILFSNIGHSLINIGNSIKNFFISIVSKIKSFFNSIKNLIKKLSPKKKEEKRELRPDEEIAERLLGKK